MRETIEQYLASGYNSPKFIKVPEECKRGLFALADDKSCQEAAKYEQKVGTSLCPLNCEKKMINIQADIPVKVLDIESVFSQFKTGKLSQGKRCDMLIHSSNTIAFIELTCTKKEYLEEGKTSPGKRAIAYEQLQETIEKLQFVPNIREKICSFSHKMAVFGYKSKEDIENNNPVNKNIASFNWIEKAHSNSISKKAMDNGFEFYTVMYPNVLTISC